MIRRALTTAGCLVLLGLSACSGFRSAEGVYTVHAESFRIFGFAIPGDDQARAVKLMQEKFPNGTVETLGSSSADWTSFWGALGNIMGFHGTKISGKTGE
jgi:hypothetical protein